MAFALGGKYEKYDLLETDKKRPVIIRHGHLKLNQIALGEI